MAMEHNDTCDYHGLGSDLRETSCVLTPDTSDPDCTDWTYQWDKVDAPLWIQIDEYVLSICVVTAGGSRERIRVTAYPVDSINSHGSIDSMDLSMAEARLINRNHKETTT